MEVKSAMGVIVACPPPARAPHCRAPSSRWPRRWIGEEEMARALLASGIIGAFIATAWTFAAEVGGCQAEGGSAVQHGRRRTRDAGRRDLPQAVAAASMALQSMLGLICDPVARRVEVPCLGKNVMAASNALACANMALAGFDPVIPLDEVIATARRVADQMPRELRCTSFGGLAITPSSLAIEQRLDEQESRVRECRMRLPVTWRSGASTRTVRSRMAKGVCSMLRHHHACASRPGGWVLCLSTLPDGRRSLYSISGSHTTTSDCREVGVRVWKTERRVSSRNC